MSPTIQSLGINELSTEDRLRLLAEIWDSLSDEELGEVADSDRAELDRRLAARESNPHAMAPWAEVQSRLRDRK